MAPIGVDLEPFIEDDVPLRCRHCGTKNKKHAPDCIGPILSAGKQPTAAEQTACCVKNKARHLRLKSKK